MPDRRSVASRRPRTGTALAAALVATAALATGCSFIPAGTGPQAASVPAPPPGAGHCCGLVVRPPQPGWGPEAVVANFLLASAIAADDFHAARQYLTKAANRAWRPGAEVTILTKEPRVTRLPSRVAGPIVLVTGQEQARLSSTGQYLPPSGGKPNEQFILQNVDGLLKIAQLGPLGSKVSHELLLTRDLFHLEYTPRNLYYYGLRNERLLPYPVFVPIQGPNPAVRLINDLIGGPTGWLGGAAQSAFPTGSHLVPPIQVFPGPSGGRTAIVNIFVPPHAEGAEKGQLAQLKNRMAAQLVTTLTSPAYSTPLYRAVKVKFNGRLWQPPHQQSTALSLSVYQQQIPHLPAGAKAYYLAQGGALRSLSAGADRGVVVTRGAGAGPVPLSKIAVSPDGRRLAGLAGPANALYTGQLVTGPGDRQSVQQLRQQLTGTSFSSLSWDNLGDLWVVGTRGHRQGVWLLVHGQAPGYPVSLPTNMGPVTSLRVAPDGVRVAMIVGRGADAHLLLAAALRGSTGFFLSNASPLGSALRPVSALTWYGEDQLLAITGSGEDTQYWDVPVDGDNPRSLIKQPGLTTVTAAGPSHPIYLGLGTSGLLRAGGLDQPLGPISPGQAIIYPG
jgi:hypothetical protein